MEFQKRLALLLGLAALLSCDSQQEELPQRVPVEIYSMLVPYTSATNQEVEIDLMARATNGCYSDLEIGMTKIDSKHFLFTGTASYHSDGGARR